MKLLLMAVVLTVLSGCGMYPQGSAGNNDGQQNHTSSMDDRGSTGGGY